MTELPKIYCINLKQSQERRKRMEQRFAYHQMTELVTFIEAIPRESPLLDYYKEGLVCPEYGEKKWFGELACYASHLKAIRQFLHDGGEAALICEDDIYLSNNFLARYVETMANSPEEAPLITLCFMMTGYGGCFWAGQDKEKKNLVTVDPVNTWGAQMYWISRDYALEVLTSYDRPFKEVKNELRTSEVIIRQSNGYMAWPPLVIEDGIDSDREPADLSFHRPHFEHWGYENYNASDSLVDNIHDKAKEEN